MTEHTPTPWDLCHHLQSAEKDASCKCGYRGSIWGGDREVLVCEMGNCNRHEGHDMVNIGDRATQLANAAFIVKAVNGHDALVARVKYLEATEANEILRLKTALKECAMRCRYDGDLFHDQGNIQRRDASWKAQEEAEAILASVSSPSTPGGES